MTAETRRRGTGASARAADFWRRGGGGRPLFYAGGGNGATRWL